MDFKRRVFGTPSSNRAELFAVLAALRACRNVKELHLYCDSKNAEDTIDHALKANSYVGQSTPNRDLILRCAEEIRMRRNDANKEFTWHKVKAHCDDEPFEHQEADRLAKQALDLQLDPNNDNEHLRRLQPAWALLHRGVPRQQDGLKTTMCALEDEAAKVGIAPHLQLSLLSDLKHTGWTQAIATHQSLDPAMQELLFRLKFGAVKGTPSSAGHKPGQPLPCPWCRSNIKHADMVGRLHGHQWADHALHECTHPGFTKARETVRTKYAAELSKRVPANKSIPNVNVKSLTATPATDPAARLPAGDQSNNENDILLDLRGYVQTDMPALAKRVGLSQHDFANALTATCRELQTFVKIHVDKEHRA